MAKFGFDSSEVDVNAIVSRDPIPAGDYTLKCLEAEEMQTKSGGTMIRAKFEVAKGEFQGRWLWVNYNIVNASEKAQTSGRQHIVSWATACGKPGADDTDKLIDRPFACTVNIEPGQNGYAASNNIKSYLMPDAADKSTKEPVKAAPAAKSTTTKAVGKTANPWD